MQKTLSDKQRQVVKDNINLVHFCIQKYIKPRYSSEYEDYFQVGCEYLCKAVLYFDETNGISLSTYAMSYILGGLKSYRRQESSLVKVPRSSLEDVAKILKYLDENKLDSPTTDVLDKFGLSQFQWRELNQALNVVSLDESVTLSKNSSKRVPRHETVADEKDYIEDWISSKSILQVVQDSLSKIDNQTHRAICKDYFYNQLLDSDITMRDIAKRYGVTGSAVHRIVDKYRKVIKHELSKVMKEEIKGEY